MSVMIISQQMIADAVKKAKSFRDYGKPNDDKMLCPILARLNKNDIFENDKQVERFFLKLYIWNVYSLERKHIEEDGFTEVCVLEDEFNKSLERAKDISVYQFDEILSFLSYNIEDYEFTNELPQDQIDCMINDVKLLKKIREQLRNRIVDRLWEENGCEWRYN